MKKIKREPSPDEDEGHVSSGVYYSWGPSSQLLAGAHSMGYGDGAAPAEDAPGEAVQANPGGRRSILQESYEDLSDL